MFQEVLPLLLLVQLPQAASALSQGRPRLSNALRLPACFKNLGHSNAVFTAGEDLSVTKMVPNKTPCRADKVKKREALEGWHSWRDQGCLSDIQTHADQVYPKWKEKLGYTGESPVQVATSDDRRRLPQLHSQVPPHQALQLHVQHCTIRTGVLRSMELSWHSEECRPGLPWVEREAW